MEVLIQVGFIINFTKSESCPSQDLVFIAGWLRTDLGMVSQTGGGVVGLCTHLSSGGSVQASPSVSAAVGPHGFLSFSHPLRPVVHEADWVACQGPLGSSSGPSSFCHGDSCIGERPSVVVAPSQPPVPELMVTMDPFLRVAAVFSRSLGFSFRILGRQTRWLCISTS